MYPLTISQHQLVPDLGKSHHYEGVVGVNLEGLVHPFPGYLECGWELSRLVLLYKEWDTLHNFSGQFLGEGVVEEVGEGHHWLVGDCSRLVPSSGHWHCHHLVMAAHTHTHTQMFFSRL